MHGINWSQIQPDSKEETGEIEAFSIFKKKKKLNKGLKVFSLQNLCEHIPHWVNLLTLFVMS